MASSYDKINRREEVNELFEQLGQVLDRKEARPHACRCPGASAGKT